MRNATEENAGAMPRRAAYFSLPNYNEQVAESSHGPPELQM